MRETPVVLVLPYFTSSSNERQAELEYCLRVNSSSQLFSKIVLLIDDETKPPVDINVDAVQLQQRATYADWIEISKSFPTGTISILANSDIAFDESVRFIQHCLQDEKGFVAISRYEISNGELQPHSKPHWSQDCWAMRSPELVTDTLLHALQIPLGVPRCDNKVVYLFKVHGWRVINPFKRVITRHIHGSQERTYDKIEDTRVLGTVAYVHPSDPPHLESMVEFDIWCLDVSNILSASVNRTLDASAPLPSYVRRKKSKKKNPPHLRVWKEAQRFASRRLRPSVNRVFGTLKNRTPVLKDHVGSDADKPMLEALNNSTSLVKIDPVVDGECQLNITPVVTLSPAPASRPESKDDLNYWQYPCLTEKHAFQVHEAIPNAVCVDSNLQKINAYIGAPWATLIDARVFPPDLQGQLSEKICLLQKFAAENRYQLTVHTVCQHYAWHRFLDDFEELGITDLHLSHCVIGLSHPRINFHSWPLYAPNIENACRSRGIRVALPLEERPLLASFIGAHMPHYRSNVREILADEARNDGGDDIYFRLSNEWHFNRTVYVEQRKGKMPPSAQQRLELKDAKDYNEILSKSVFSLCPEGAGPNTLRLWESLAVGAIPVVIGGGDWRPPALGKDEAALQKACLFVDRSETVGLFERLRSIDASEIRRRQRAALECYQLARNKTAFDFLL